MALPDGVLTCTVRFGPFTDFLGEIAQGAVVFTPSRSLIWIATGVPILASDLKIALVGGEGEIELPYTDQPGFSDGQGHSVSNWTYKATFSISGGLQAPPVVNFQVPMGPSEMDLDLVTPAGSSSGVVVALPEVLSVNGQTGNVVIEAGEGGGGGPVEWVQVLNKPTTFTPTAHNHTTDVITDMAATGRNVARSATAAIARDAISAASAAELIDLRSRTRVIWPQAGASYPSPLPTGVAGYEFIGTLDPATQFTLTGYDIWRQIEE